ncbi:MAG: hypothetical protein GX318_07265 [Clostridia bacterium]|nr:hypothetical protein [Clostridia bacterium]
MSRTYGRHHQEHNLVDSIKQEVLMDLGIHQQGQSHQWNRSLIETIKNEVLHQIQGEGRSHNHGDSYYHSDSSAENIDRGERPYYDAERETREAPYRGEYGNMSESYHGDPNAALIQAVKDSVMAEMNISKYR